MARDTRWQVRWLDADGCLLGQGAAHLRRQVVIRHASAVLANARADVDSTVARVEVWVREDQGYGGVWRLQERVWERQPISKDS